MRAPGNIEVNELRNFLALADELNFARAAEEVKQSQASFSRSIMRLEEKVGARLVERTTRRVSLTRAGEQFQSQVQGILQAIELACEKARRTDGGVFGNLRIGFTEFAMAGPLPAIIREFQKTCPDVKCKLVKIGTLKARELLENRRLDVAFTLPTDIGDHLNAERVWSEQYVIIMPRDHPLAAYEKVTPDLLKSALLVLGDRRVWLGYRRILKDLFSEYNVRLNIAAEAPDHTGIIGLVSAGMGVTVSVFSTAQSLPAHLTSRPLDLPKSSDNLSHTEFLWHREIDNESVRLSLRAAIKTTLGEGGWPLKEAYVTY